MKPLLLTLLIFWQIQGICQRAVMYNKETSMNELHEYSFGKHYVTPLNIHIDEDLFIRQLSKQWLIYKQECWNDSTEIKQIKFVKYYETEFYSFDNMLTNIIWGEWENMKNTTCISSDIPESEYQIRTIWTHPIKPTSEGFLDWLADKWNINIINK